MGENCWRRFWRALGCSLFSGAAVVAQEIRQPVNYFVMQAVHDENVPNSVLASPKLQGIHIRDDWRRVEPQSNVMSFAWIDGQVARAKSLGKQVTLGVYTGNNSPNWLGVPRVDGVPIPWSPTVIAAHNELVAELGNRYRNETAIAAVHISSPATDASLEMHYPAGLTNVAGYSDAVIIDVWKSAIDAYAAAFPHNVLVLDVAMEPNDGGGVTFPVIDYARSVLGPRASFIHCSLKASTNVNAAHHSAIVDLGEDGARIGFEMVSPSTDQERFGGSFAAALVLGQQAGATWYQVYQADVPLLPDANEFIGDYNRDGAVDAADYTVWRNSLGTSTNLAADGDGSQSVDEGDYDIWRRNYGTTTSGGIVAGDFNLDGYVDAADYTAWRNSLGNAIQLAADGDRNGIVDAADYNLWRQNYGVERAGSGAALFHAAPQSVAEPSGMLLIIACLLLHSSVYRSRSSAIKGSRSINRINGPFADADSFALPALLFAEQMATPCGGD